MSQEIKKSFFQPLLMGATAGCFAVTITNPIDLVKTRLQLQGELKKKGTYQKQIDGVFDTLKKTYKHEGIFALQKGLPAALCFQIIMNGIRLGMYDNLKNLVVTTNKSVKALSSIAFGGSVGFIGGFCGSPFNLVKTRLMLESNFLVGGDRYNYKGVKDAFVQIYSKDGLSGIFKGSALFGCRTMLASIVQLPTFDLSQHIVKDIFSLEGNQALVLASAMSTTATCIAMCPIDGISTRYFNQPYDQVNHLIKSILKSSEKENYTKMGLMRLRKLFPSKDQVVYTKDLLPLLPEWGHIPLLA